MFEYTKHYYGKHAWRMNPNYPPHYCFTLCKCEKCGEFYEADFDHFCRLQNSYPELLPELLEEADDGQT